MCAVASTPISFDGVVPPPPTPPRKGEGSRAATILLFSALTLLTACGAKSDDKERVTPSGLPVPRYVSLKFDPVNARAGPSDDHRLLWVFHARGLPVQVVAETAEWRRICDPDGGMSWVHKRTTDGHRTVVALGQQPLALKAKPKDDAAVVAYLAPKAIAGFEKCEKDWCRVRAGSADGWAPASAFWGVADPPQCTAPPPPAGASSAPAH